MTDPEAPPESLLAHAIHQAAELLPAQGPITVFIHHNTLHSFEHLPFEEAVVAGGELLGCEPYLPESHYRAELHRGRIRDSDLRAALLAHLGKRSEDVAGGFATRETIRDVWLRCGIPEASGEALEWLLHETEVLDAAREDLPPEARARLLGDSPSPLEERRAVRDLWRSCRLAVTAAPAPPRGPRLGDVRHRDSLLAATGEDPDALVHPLLLRLSAAYLDQGIATWEMPGREEGFFRCVLRLYAAGAGPPTPWVEAARRIFRQELAEGRTAEGSIRRSLEALGVEADEWGAYLRSAALALRGWAGMMRQFEERPDRVPVHAVPATLADFLAVRLILDRAAAADVAARCLAPGVELARLRRTLAAPAGAPPTPDERAWPLFHLSQLLGRRAAEVSAMAPEAVRAVLAEIDAFDGLTRRRLLHHAYERRLRHQFLDAVGSHLPLLGGAPRFQAVFCIDEREESMRRHLEEADPEVETYGAAGFFGVAIYYKGAEEAHARPLCPVVIQPEHEVEEIRPPGTDVLGLRARGRRVFGRLDLGTALGSRGMIRGAVSTVLLGALAAVPLVLRVLSPRLAARLLHRGRALLAGNGRGRLALERREGPPSLGRYAGFTHEEMAAIVRRLLEEAGMRSLSPLVFIVGHGSTSLNNPHESAHDCGACGGGRGGPNARAFAQMANYPEVRRLLAAQGIAIPPMTWFVGAEHNTASDAIDYFDLDRVPEAARPLLRQGMAALSEARLRNAHERCRRFKAAPLWYPKRLCLAHVETRAEDLAQTRPEYGHATNAFCVVGRRDRTRGLFLDRRAFLVSYDPTLDDREGSILARVLAGIVPVVAGISLEYYFAFVDPTGYGCGTKLPHNVTALLGVMDGHAGDLRTGLPRQMIEIHEPVRLLMLVETSSETLRRVVRANPAIDRLVSNRWMTIASLDPRSADIEVLDGERFAAHRVESRGAGEADSSARWYRGRREFLDFARIVPPPEGRGGA